MIEEVVVETVLNELAKRLTDETAISVRDVKDRVCEEMRVSDNSDIASDSSEGDQVSESQGDKSDEDLDFIEEDGIIYMFVSSSSMT